MQAAPPEVRVAALAERADRVVAADQVAVPDRVEQAAPVEYSRSSAGSQVAAVSRNPGGREIDVTKIALPVENGRLSTHFGHSAEFGIFEIRGEEIVGENYVKSPGHAPGVLPSWLMEQGVSTVIAGGLGRRAIARFEEAGIEVICGAPEEQARDVVTSYLNGTLVTGQNVCDH